jgi:hypothetical protein
VINRSPKNLSKGTGTCLILLICLTGAFVRAQAATTEKAHAAYFIARTNEPVWTIFLQNIASGQTSSISSHYLSGDSYIAEQLSPGVYRIRSYRKYDNQVVLPKVDVQFTVFEGCTNFYGRLDLYEDGSVMPGKAVVTDSGALDIDELRTLGVRIKSLFANNALCVSGERDDFRFEWNAIKQYVEAN